MRLTTFLFCFFNIFQCYSQDDIIVSGSYSDEVSNLETKEQAKERIKKKALINALEKGFGTAIFEGNTMYIRNTDNGTKVETTTGFNMIAETYVKGEVVEELSVNFKETPTVKEITVVSEKRKKPEKRTENILYIQCDVKIRAREYVEPVCEFDARTLSCADTSCSTTSFHNGDDFYVYFKSKKSGFLTIFLDDNASSAILLPYQSNRQNFQQGYPIEAEKEYILFKNDKKYFDPNKTSADELLWETKENLEKLSLIFTTKPLELPYVKKTDQKASSYPDNLPSEEFNKWLINLREKNKTVEIKRIYLDTQEY
jgi:hypothetical protein